MRTAQVDGNNLLEVFVTVQNLAEEIAHAPNQS